MQIEQLATKLESLGLSDKEAKVYVANLFLGPAPVQKIAEQTSQSAAPVVRFYRGVEGFKAIDSYLKRRSAPKAEIYAITNVDEVLKIFPDMLKQNPEYRLKKKLSSKLIYSYSKGELPSDK